MLCDRAEDRPRGSEGRDLARRCTIIALGSGGELATIIESRAMTHSLTIGWATALDDRYVSSVSETWLDTHVYPVYLTVTILLLMAGVSSVSETRPDTPCILCIPGPPSVYLSSRATALEVHFVLPKHTYGSSWTVTNSCSRVHPSYNIIVWSVFEDFTL